MMHGPINIRIKIRNTIKYLKLNQLVSDHKRAIREFYKVLGYIYSNGSIVSVDMDVVGVTAAYLL